MRSVRERLAALQPSTAQPPRRVAVPAGQPRVSSDCLVIEKRWPLDVAPELPALGAAASRLLAVLSGHQPAPLSEYLFLDTETTGLAGGTGTHAFLVGVGHVEDDQVCLRQYFMRHPAEEPALLEQIVALLPRFRVLVTFNGRSFDWPLLETRLVLHGHRIQAPPEHLDLLHPARRIWRHRLASCSLTSIEASVLGVRRVGDVPGFLIPSIYFRYLRDGDSRPLEPVFHHNRLDVLALMRLAGHLVMAEESPAHTLDHPADVVGIALQLLQQGEIERAVTALEHALDDPRLSPTLRFRAEAALCRCLKRAGRAGEALPIWERMCARALSLRPLDLYPFAELAKYYEHTARDPDAALRVVERALRLLDMAGERRGRDDLLHRAARLRGKALAARHATDLC